MKVLVTGGAGFIGSHLVQQLSDAGVDATVLDRAFHDAAALGGATVIREELDNRGVLKTALRDVEVVYHLAWSGIHLSSNQDWSAHISNNLLPTVDLLKLCCENGVRRFVFVSSGGAVYGPSSQPIREDHPTYPLSVYGATKLAVETHVRLASQLYGLEYAILRPSVPYGERQDPGRGQGAVAVFLHRVIHGEPIVLWGGASIVRDFFYVGDMARALVLAADERVESGVYNIGGGQPITLAGLVERISEITGLRAHTICEAAREFDPSYIVLDIEKAKRVMGWEPQTSLDDGIVRTWEWMEETAR